MIEVKAYLDPFEVTSLENAAENLRDRLLIHMLFHLGCRVSEAISLTTDNVDLENSSVTIQHLKTRLKLFCPGCGTHLGKNHKFCPKCGIKVSEAVAKGLENRRQRVLPMDPETLVVLKEYINRGGPVTKSGKTLIFSINRHRAWQIVKQCSERAGLPKLVNPETGKVHNVSPHKLRDAFAVMAVKSNDSGDGLRLLQEHLGHQSFNTTARYRKVSGQEHRDWYQELWKGDKK